MWIYIDKLPIMFEDVLVLGRRKGDCFDRKVYQARRWSGMNFNQDKTFSWLTSRDETIADVEYWMPIPQTPYEAFYDLERMVKQMKATRKKNKELI